MDMTEINKALDGLEKKMEAFATKAAEEIKTAGSASVETKNAIEALGKEQRAFADRLLLIEQKSVESKQDADAPNSWGAQFVKAEHYKAFLGRNLAKASVEVESPIEVKNTLTTTVGTNSFAQHRPGVVPGAFPELAIENLFTHIPTAAGAIDFMKESAWTNNAAETAEGAVKPESALTIAAVTMPMATVAHWLKISRQLAEDNPALAVYIDTRLRFGVDNRVDTQLVAGNGVAPNLSGIFTAGNYVAHGFADATLPATAGLKKIALLIKVKAALKVAGYATNAVLLHPVDVGNIMIDLLSVSNGLEVLVSAGGLDGLLGFRVIEAIGMTQGSFLMGSFSQGATVWDREAVRVDMSESDGDNFQRNLITVRAERRLALTVESPSAFRGGTLTPA